MGGADLGGDEDDGEIDEDSEEEIDDRSAA
jgi:hypothetical protein